MFDARVRAGVLRLSRPGTRWLSTGWGGGYRVADAAYNVSVPEGWSRTDLDAYVAERRRAAGFGDDGPALLTGVDLEHARGARLGPVVAYATAGVSNPAALPGPPTGHEDGLGRAGASSVGDDGFERADAIEGTDPTGRDVGTVNVLVGTTRALTDAGLATLLGGAVEAKTATLLSETGFTGTTTDAVVVGCDPDGAEATFAGSATPVGAAARACVREAVRASLASRYASRERPETVEDAAYGVVTDRRAEVFEVGEERPAAERDEASEESRP